MPQLIRVRRRRLRDSSSSTNFITPQRVSKLTYHTTSARFLMWYIMFHTFHSERSSSSRCHSSKLEVALHGRNNGPFRLPLIEPARFRCRNLLASWSVSETLAASMRHKLCDTSILSIVARCSCNPSHSKARAFSSRRHREIENVLKKSGLFCKTRAA